MVHQGEAQKALTQDGHIVSRKNQRHRGDRSRDQQGSHQPAGFVKDISGVGVRVDI